MRSKLGGTETCGLGVGFRAQGLAFRAPLALLSTCGLELDIVAVLGLLSGIRGSGLGGGFRGEGFGCGLATGVRVQR